jgi:hypothetical protein
MSFQSSYAALQSPSEAGKFIANERTMSSLAVVEKKSKKTMNLVIGLSIFGLLVVVTIIIVFSILNKKKRSSVKASSNVSSVVTSDTVSGARIIKRGRNDPTFTQYHDQYEDDSGAYAGVDEYHQDEIHEYPVRGASYYHDDQYDDLEDYENPDEYDESNYPYDDEYPEEAQDYDEDDGPIVNNKGIKTFLPMSDDNDFANF